MFITFRLSASPCFRPATRLHFLFGRVTAPGGEYMKIIIFQEALQDEFRLQVGVSRVPAEVPGLDTAHQYH